MTCGMARVLLLVAALVAGASSFVYTCNEVKQMLETGGITIAGNRACVVLPAAVKFPFNDQPYSWYLYNTYITDTATGQQYELTGFEEEASLCRDGAGPWTITSDDPGQFKCSSTQYKYAEIIFLFTSDAPNIVRAAPAPTTSSYGKGTHVFVAPEASMIVEKKSIADGKETTLQWFSGAGADETEERFAMMPEKFVAGASTVIIGPVTTLVIEDDVSVELAVTSFQDDQFISATPGASFSLMTTGRANDLQSSRPNILVSTAYGINDDTFGYDAISVTGTVKMDDAVATTLTIECDNKETSKKIVTDITTTSDVTINNDCSSLDITYKGSVAPEEIDRSSEVIYLQITSSADFVLKTQSTTRDPDATDAPVPTKTTPTRRTFPPTSPVTRPTFSTVSTSLRPSSTHKPDSTTTSASGISIVSALAVAMLRLL